MKRRSLLLLALPLAAQAPQKSVVRIESIRTESSLAIIRDLNRRRRVRALLPASALQLQPGDIVRMTWEIRPGESFVRCLAFERADASAAEEQRRRAHNSLGNWDMRKKEPD